MNLTALTSAARRQTSLTTSDISDADVLTILNEGIQEISAMQRWDFLHTREVIDVVANTVEANLPSDFRLMDFVQQVGKRNGPLVMLSFSEYSYRYGDDPSTGSQARYFYLRTEDGTQKIGFYPTPASSGTGAYEIFYFKSPTLLVNGSDEPEWDDQFHRILVDYAAFRLWEREEYFDESQRAFQRYARTLGDMVKFYRMRHKQTRMIVGGGAHARGYGDIRYHYGWE